MTGQGTPKGLRLHIGIAGRRNAGKSSLLNAIAGQEVAIASARPGTTTDPVEKTMEIAGMGPVVLVDTAGLDDIGELGEMRVRRSLGVLARMDMAILVTNGHVWEEPEAALAEQLKTQGIPFIIARNMPDNVAGAAYKEQENFTDAPVVDISALGGEGIGQLLEKLREMAKGLQDESPALLAGLLPENGVALLVVPLDSGAPKGRLILPQVQAIRGALDGGSATLVVTDVQYAGIWEKLAVKPDIVICDSQVIDRVARMTPESVPLTTFSILMARNKGNLVEFARGAAALGRLCPGDCVFIQEACSHHPQADDIGRVKIPRLLERMAGGKLEIICKSGKEICASTGTPAVIVHCGGCVITMRQMLVRQGMALEAGIPMTNYGMAISCANGMLQRVLSPFPEALAAFNDEIRERH